MKPMLATMFDTSQVKYPCFIQPKYDGFRCMLEEGEDGEVHLTSRGGKEYNVPHIKAWGEAHRGLLPLDGEIYNHRELTFQQICSAVKCRSEWTDKLRMVVYDMPITGSFAYRWQQLKEMFKNVADDEPVYLTQTQIADNESHVHSWHKVFVSLGYEGAIIRNAEGKYIQGRSNNLMKLKHFDTTEFEIVDILEAGGQDAGTAIFKLKCNGYEFCARPVGSKYLRAEYLRDRLTLIGQMATVQHQGYSDAGVPRFPVLLSIRDYE
jgi:ATP-dependent DNA ligase